MPKFVILIFSLNFGFTLQSQTNFSTNDDRRDWPYGGYRTLTIENDSDRNGISYEKIIPNISVIKQDNFDNLLLDQNISESIKFINKK